VICPRKYVRFANDLLAGVKNGRRIGKKSGTAQMPVGKVKGPDGKTKGKEGLECFKSPGPFNRNRTK